MEVRAACAMDGCGKDGKCGRRKVFREEMARCARTEESDNESKTQKFFFSSRRRHTRSKRDWSSDVCSSDLDQRILTSEIDLHQATIWRSLSTSAAVPQAKVLAPLTMRAIRPVRTLPGPISTYSASGKCDAISLTSCAQRTGDVSCRSKRSFASVEVVDALPVTLENTGNTGSVNAEVAMAFVRPTTAGSINGE